MTKLEELKAHCEAAADYAKAAWEAADYANVARDAADYANVARDAADYANVARDAAAARDAYWDAYQKELKKQENSDDH
jgi:hypothetical protein